MKKKIILFLIPMVVFIGIFILFRSVFFIGYVPTASMEPTIKTNSVIFGTRLYTDLAVGDIVVFKYEGRILVKRIAAIEKQTFELEGKIYVVPAGCYFMMGDNTEDSWDSRYWDYPFIEKKMVIAKIYKQ